MPETIGDKLCAKCGSSLLLHGDDLRCPERDAAYEVECGSDEERDLRGLWLSRLMFGWMIGQRDPGTYEEWLTRQGVRLV